MPEGSASLADWTLARTTPADLVVIDWRAVLACDDGNQLQPAVSEVELDRAEAMLDAVFSDDLRDLYRATDGVFDKPGQWFVVWPMARAQSLGVGAGVRRSAEATRVR